jgi:hypothetical protein
MYIQRQAEQGLRSAAVCVMEGATAESGCTWNSPTFFGFLCLSLDILQANYVQDILCDITPNYFLVVLQHRLFCYKEAATFVLEIKVRCSVKRFYILKYQ